MTSLWSSCRWPVGSGQPGAPSPTLPVSQVFLAGGGQAAQAGCGRSCSVAGPGSPGLGPGSCVGHSSLPWLVLSIRGLAHSQCWAEPSEAQLLAGQEARCLSQACVQSRVLLGGPGGPGCGEGSSVVTADRPAGRSPVVPPESVPRVAGKGLPVGVCFFLSQASSAGVLCSI